MMPAAAPRRRRAGTRRLHPLGSIVMGAIATLVGLTGDGTAATAQRQATDPRPVFRAGVELVVLHVAVLDDDGEPVTGLRPADFLLEEDGAPQELALFASSEDTPLDVALVLDASGSVARSAPSVRADAAAFLGALGDNDCVYFVPFRETVGVGLWSAPREPGLAEFIAGVELDGGTALYDAIGQGLASVDRSRYRPLPGETIDVDGPFDGPFCGVPLPPANIGSPGSVRRTAVVVLSDGGDEHSVSTYADTLVRAWSTPVPIFAVAIGDALPPRRRRMYSVGSAEARRFRRLRAFSEALENRLGQLTSMTGGRLIMGNGRAAVQEAFEEVVTMLRSSYLIGYHPPEAAGAAATGNLSWHRVSLATPEVDTDLYVRPGYYRNLADTAGAEDIVRSTPALLQNDQPLLAIDQLDLALRLDPGYWPTYLQRARARLRLGRLPEARGDLETVLMLRPGLGSVHALLSDTALQLDDSDTAWYHAIRAAQDEIDVDELLRELTMSSTAPPDLRAQLEAVRVAVDVGPTPEELDQGTLLELVRVLRTLLSEAPEVGLISEAKFADFGLLIDVKEVEGTPRRLRGELVVNGLPFEPLHREKLEIGNLDDPMSLAAGLTDAAARVREWLAEQR